MFMGSSPLTRGKPFLYSRLGCRKRLIPAHAGKTGTRTVSSCSEGGSSPLTRGKPSAGGGAASRGRLIPAHAGKTSQSGTMRAGFTAHPRSRGENLAVAWEVDDGAGSSPLTRGKHPVALPECLLQRLIPAHAGKTGMWRLRRANGRAHPRSRGENAAATTLADDRAGSSPLTRGKLRLRRRREAPLGLIPAHAGKTCSCPPPRRQRRAHPRSRGENGHVGDRV